MNDIINKAKDYAWKYRRDFSDWGGKVTDDIFEAYKKGAEEFINVIEWETGTPKDVGIYIITNMWGKIDYSIWSGEWQYYNNDEVIAYSKIQNIKPYKNI